MSAPLWPPMQDCPPCSTQSTPTFPDTGSSCCPVCPTDGGGGGTPGPQGPKGDPGANGTDGTDGIDAFTTTSGFTQPAVSGNVTIPVANSLWMAAGQIVFIPIGGYYTVVSAPTSVTVQIQNLGYTGNAAPGTVIGASKVSPGGVKGTDGAAGPSGPTQIYYGSGDPNGVVTALRPSMYYTDDGHLWVKLNVANDNTNWGMLL